jgi:acetyl esterase/lipase
MPDPNSPDGPNGIFVLPAAQTRHLSRKWLDLPYGVESPFQKLDVFLPDRGQGPWPVVVYVHGGAWMMCDKSDLQVEPALYGLTKGWAVVSVNYRLSSEARYPAQLHDVQAAIHWVRANASVFDFDPRRVAVCGSSAGAHLAAHAALQGARSKTIGVGAAVIWYGPTNFLKMDDYLRESGAGVADHGEVESPESRLLGGKISLLPELVRDANPETWITSEAPPFLIQHGTADPIVPWQLARDFALRLEVTIGKSRVELDLIPGAGHAGPEFATEENCRRTFDFLDKWLGAGGRT